MTTSDHKKVLKQIGHKPGKYAKYKKHSTPKERKTGMLKKRCLRCGRTGAPVGKYSIQLCRCCFRDNAIKIGFKKYS